MIESKSGQRAMGVLVLVGASAVVAWSWYTAKNAEYYYDTAVLGCPAFAVIGFGLLVFPMDMEKFRAEFGASKPSKFSHYPIEWKVLMFVALAASLVNWYAISHL